jgi:S-adenosyl methyltransferase
VHQVAQAASPAARVAYVDNDAVVLAHARALLARDSYTTVTGADLRKPAEVLTDPGLLALIDLARPAAVLMIAVLHFVGDDENVPAIVAQYRDALAPGSYLAMSLGTTDGVDPAKIADAQRVYRSSTAQLTYRGRAQIEELFDGFEMVEPGLVRLPQWRPDSELAARAERDGSEWMLGGVGRKKTRVVDLRPLTILTAKVNEFCWRPGRGFGCAGSHPCVVRPDSNACTSTSLAVCGS